MLKKCICVYKDKLTNLQRTPREDQNSLTIICTSLTLTENKENDPPAQQPVLTCAPEAES